MPLYIEQLLANPKGFQKADSREMVQAVRAHFVMQLIADKLLQTIFENFNRTVVKRFFKELQERPDELAQLCEAAERQSVLLLYAARDEKHNNAVALKEFLEKRAVEQDL